MKHKKNFCCGLARITPGGGSQQTGKHGGHPRDLLPSEGDDGETPAMQILGVLAFAKALGEISRNRL